MTAQENKRVECDGNGIESQNIHRNTTNHQIYAYQNHGTNNFVTSSVVLIVVRLVASTLRPSNEASSTLEYTLSCGSSKSVHDKIISMSRKPFVQEVC